MQLIGGVRHGVAAEDTMLSGVGATRTTEHTACLAETDMTLVLIGVGTLSINDLVRWET